MKKPLIFVGSRQKMTHLLVAAELSGYEVVGILDHHYYNRINTICGAPVIGDERWLLDSENKHARKWLDTCVFFPANFWTGCQYTNPADLNLQELRLQRIDILEKSNAEVISLIHPASVNIGASSKYASVSFGKGVFIDDNCWVAVHEVHISDYCVVGIGATIAPYVTLGYNSFVAASAYVQQCIVGSNSYIGEHARICLPTEAAHTTMTSIGSDSTVWSGAQVDRPLPDQSIYTHNNRILKKTHHLSPQQE